MTMEANLTNRDATVGPQPYVKWSHEPPRAQDVPAAIGRAIHHASLPPQGPAFVSIPMDDWDVEADEDRSRNATIRTTTGRALPDPDALAELARPARAGPQSGDGRRPRHRRQRWLGRRPWRSPRSSACRCGRRPRRAADGSASRRPIRTSSECYRRRSARSARRSRSTTSCSSLAPRYSRTTRTSPARCWPMQRRSCRSRATPREAARAPMGDAIVGDVALALERLVELVGESERDAARGRGPSPATRRRPIRSAARRRWPALAAAWPEDGIAVLETPSCTLALRNRLRISQPGQLLLQRQRRARLRDLGGGRRPARAAGAAGRVRARRGLGAVRDHGAVDRGRLQAARHVPRAAQRGVHDPQVVRRVRAGAGRAGTRPARPRRRRGRRALRHAGARGRPAATSSSEALREAIAADDGPRLVQVQVASGMWLE